MSKNFEHITVSLQCPPALIPNASFVELYTHLPWSLFSRYLYAVLNGPPWLLPNLKCLVGQWSRVQHPDHSVPVSGLWCETFSWSVAIVLLPPPDLQIWRKSPSVWAYFAHRWVPRLQNPPLQLAVLFQSAAHSQPSGVIEAIVSSLNFAVHWKHHFQLQVIAPKYPKRYQLSALITLLTIMWDIQRIFCMNQKIRVKLRKVQTLQCWSWYS